MRKIPLVGDKQVLQPPVRCGSAYSWWHKCNTSRHPTRATLPYSVRRCTVRTYPSHCSKANTMTIAIQSASSRTLATAMLLTVLLMTPTTNIHSVGVHLASADRGGWGREGRGWGGHGYRSNWCPWCRRGHGPPRVRLTFN